MTEKRLYLLSKRWWRMRRARNGRGCNRRLTRPRNREITGIIQMKQRGLKWSKGLNLVKIDKLFIQNEGDNYKTLPDVLAYIYFSIHSIWKALGHPRHEMWSLQPNSVPYFICMLGAATILDYWIAVEILDMLEKT